MTSARMRQRFIYFYKRKGKGIIDLTEMPKVYLMQENDSELCIFLFKSNIKKQMFRDSCLKSR